jgi:small-conductance mechanosensitive channel
VIAATAQIEPGTWLRIVLVLLGAFALSRVLPRLVRRATRRMLESHVRQRFAVLRAHAPRAFVDSGPIPAVRYAQRAEALGTLAKHLTSFAIWGTAVMLVLHDLDVALVTLVTGAGFLGVAVALGAQDLLRDYTAGFFMLLDDRLGVGDRVEVGAIVGDIEEMNLRWTCIRDAQGTEWYVPNGRLQEVGNRSQHRGKAIIDVEVPSELRLADAEERIAKALCNLHDDPRVGAFVLEEPEILGVETLTRDGATVRIAVHTSAARQTEVARAVRARVRAAFERGHEAFD